MHAQRQHLIIVGDCMVCRPKALEPLDIAQAVLTPAMAWHTTASGGIDETEINAHFDGDDEVF